MSNPALELRDISKTYNAGQPNQVAVLRGLSLRINPGEMVALVAPSGAGKSTLLHMAGLLDVPDSGRVVLNGRDVSALTDAKRTRLRRQELGFVYQFHHLLPEFSARENVIVPQLANGVGTARAQARADDLLGRVGLGTRMLHRPGALSGGEQQRVALCRALANAPRVLLADEPTGNLDPETSAAVFEVLQKMVREDGLAALIATHNLDLAAQMDRTVRLAQGTLSEG